MQVRLSSHDVELPDPHQVMPMYYNLVELPPCGSAIHSLLTVGHDDDRREVGMGVRYPFFQTVSIATDRVCQVAFCRDISTDGIGLLHRMPIEPRDVAVTFTSQRGTCTVVQVRIIWCQPGEQGWYTSGGHVLSTPTSDEAEETE